MKKITLLLALLAFVNVLSAQSRREAAKEKKEAKIEEYKDRLELSDLQMEEIKEVRMKYKPDLQEIRNDDSMEKSEKMRASADVIEQMEGDLAGVLTPSQLEEWKAIKKEVKENMENRKERRRGRRGGGN